MASIFSDGALHPGRDPNDSSWRILRSPTDWATAVFGNAIYDPRRKTVELAPRAASSGACDADAERRFAASGEVVVGPIDGLVEDLAWHRVIVDAATPEGTRVAVQTFATDDPAAPTAPIPWAPAAPVAIPDPGDAGERELQRPVLSDVGRGQRASHGAYRRAFPEIATYDGDGPNGAAALTLAGNGLARVRIGDVVELSAVISTTPSERVAIAAIPARRVRLAGHGAMHEFGAGTAIVVRERDGAEPFAGPRTVYTLAPGETIDLSSVAPDGTLAEVSVPHAAAALWRRGDVIDLVAATATATIIVEDIPGEPVTVALAAAPAGDFRRSAARLIATVDRLFVAADDAGELGAFVPPDEPIEVTGLTAGVPFVAHAQIRWTEPDLGAVWLAPGTALAWADWEAFTTSPGGATDRGRYLWLRLHLVGATLHPGDDDATATPTIRSIRLLRPRLSYLRYLPATYARRDGDDPTGALFLERMLALLEHRFTAIESSYESVARQLDPLAADPDWLRFIAAWFDLYFDPALPAARRALLVTEIHTLYARRGTPEGIARYIEIITGDRPEIVEGFQIRPGAGLILGCSGVLGCAALGGLDDIAATSVGVLSAFAHRFTIYVFTHDPCQVERLETAMRALIDSIKPAHTLVDLHVALPGARVGSAVGIDLVLGDERALPHALGERSELGVPHPVLGVDSILLPPRAPIVGERIDRDLTL